MATINMHMKFEIEIPKQTWTMLRKPCRLQTDGQTDGRTDKVNPVYMKANFVEWGYKNQMSVNYLAIQAALPVDVGSAGNNLLAAAATPDAGRLALHGLLEHTGQS